MHLVVFSREGKKPTRHGLVFHAGEMATDYLLQVVCKNMLCIHINKLVKGNVSMLKGYFIPVFFRVYVLKLYNFVLIMFNY